MSSIYRNRALCVTVSVLNKCIMARNSMADMVIGASDVGGTTGGIGDVAGRLVEVASGIDGAAGVGDAAGTGGINFEESSSCYGCSVCGDIGDAGLGVAASGAE